jgi:ribosomal protein S12 methylthiotransferase accessory factor
MKIGDYYTHLAAAYEGERQSALGIIPESITTFFASLPRPSRILDAGCGPGIESRIAMEHGHQVFGLDVSEGMIARFRQNNPRATATVGDIREIPLPAHAVDAVFASACLLHLSQDDANKALSEFSRVLTPGGQLFVFTFAGESSFEEHYTHKVGRPLELPPILFKHWEHGELRSAIETAGFKIDRWETVRPYPDRPPWIIGVATCQDLSRSDRPTDRVLCDFAGVTRLSRIDDLAGLGVPVFSAARPQSIVAITTSTGKGLSVEESRMSALYEALEIAAAEHDLPGLAASQETLHARGADFVPPSAMGASVDADAELEWTVAREWGSQTPVLVPLAAVTMRPMRWPFRPHSTGLAAGQSLAATVLHGLLEVLERHALSLAIVRRDAPTVDPASADDPDTVMLLRTALDAGLTVSVKDLTTYTTIPCYRVFIRSPFEQDPRLINDGCACHPSPVVALRRAFLEALQSRIVAIADAREDLADVPKMGAAEYEHLLEEHRYWYFEGDQRIALDAQSVASEGTDAAATIDVVFARATKQDSALKRLFYKVLPSPTGTYVTRVMIEGAEAFSFDPARASARLAAMAKTGSAT